MQFNLCVAMDFCLRSRKLSEQPLARPRDDATGGLGSIGWVEAGRIAGPNASLSHPR